MSCYNIHVIEAVVPPSAAPTAVGQHWIDTVTGELWESNGIASVANWVLNDIKVRVSANDTTAGYLNGKLVAGTGITLTENNDGGNETLTITSIANLNNTVFRYDGHFLNELRHTLADASSGYPVTASPGALATDVTYPHILILPFDDTSPEGVAWGSIVPAGATSLNFRYVSKPRTIPAGAVDVQTKLYSRQFPDNVAPSAFSAGTVLGTLAFAANLNMRIHTQTATLAALGITAGDFYQFELIRDAAHASDTLVGDWQLVTLVLFFS